MRGEGRTTRILARTDLFGAVGPRPGGAVRTRLPATATLAVALLAGCVALGWRFGPGASHADPTLFAAPPAIERRGDAYLLVWTQGTHPFFFAPSYEVMDDRLVFALGATASSGNLAGRRREMRIQGAENIEALRRGGAFWWERSPEPDGTLVPLRLDEP